MFKKPTLLSLVIVTFLSLSFVNFLTFPKSQVKDHQTSLSRELSEARRINLECLKEGKANEFCYAKKLGELTQNNSLDLVVQTLTQLEQLDPNSRGCHLISHTITLFEVQKDPDSWQGLLQKVDPDRCSGGFLHGVLEAHSRFDKNFALDQNSIPEICSLTKPRPEKAKDELSCAHILGHILLATENTKIPSAVGICEKTRPDLRYECLSGVFMENMTKDNLIAHGLVNKSADWNKQAVEDQEKICQSHTDLAAQACWREIVHMYAFSTQNDPIKVYDLCRTKTNSRDSLKECYLHGVGIMTSAANFNEENLGWLCNPYKESDSEYYECIEHTLGSLMASSAQFADRANNFCQSVKDAEKQSCLNSLGTRLAKLK